MFSLGFWILTFFYSDFEFDCYFWFGLCLLTWIFRLLICLTVNVEGLLDVWLVSNVYLYYECSWSQKPSELLPNPSFKLILTLVFNKVFNDPTRFSNGFIMEQLFFIKCISKPKFLIISLGFWILTRDLTFYSDFDCRLKFLFLT